MSIRVDPCPPGVSLALTPTIVGEPSLFHSPIAHIFAARGRDTVLGYGVYLWRQGALNCPCALALTAQAPAGAAAALLEAMAHGAAARHALCLQAVMGAEKDQSLWLRAGFSPWFTTRLMAYPGGPMPEPPFPIIPYTDAWYRPFQRLESQAFFALRQAQDVRPHRAEPSIRDRLARAARGQELFLLLENGRLAAAGSAGSMLDDIAVDGRCRGKGYGRAMVAHGVNLLLARGATPTLEVLDWNVPALRLYESMGFATTQRLQVLRREL